VVWLVSVREARHDEREPTEGESSQQTEGWNEAMQGVLLRVRALSPRESLSWRA
jgi:hypothetical protein